MHIHIPDGVLPFWLWSSGFLIALTLLGAFSSTLKVRSSKIAFAALATALVLVVMSVPLGLPIHLNLIALVGIIIGPAWSLYVAFAVNLILAGFGHGGMTVVGLNTLLLWLQAAAAYFLFYYLFRIMVHNKAFRAGLAVFVALAVSFVFLVFVASLPHQVEPGQFSIQHHHEHDHEHEYDHDHAEETEPTEEASHEFNLWTFVALSGPLVFVVALIEVFIAVGSVKFIDRVKPELLNS